jgi:glycosyltransferase involved in cell wall biosynthesis
MKYEPPIVSVITPTYNRAHLVGRAIRSVLDQTYEKFELIVVDDASNDHTEQVVRVFTDARIRYVRHDRNMGGSASRNTGIRAAEGLYIAFLDDDDEWMRTKLEKQVKRMLEVHGSVGVIDSGYEVFREGTSARIGSYTPGQGGISRKKILLGQMVGGITVLVKRECFAKVGLFDEELQSCQDWDMWKRISDHYDFDSVPDILTRVYLHPDQISSNMESLIRGKTRVIEKHMRDFEEHPQILIIHLKKLAKLHCINGTWKEALACFKRILKVEPMEIIKILGWCLIELPIVKIFSREGSFRKYARQ